MRVSLVPRSIEREALNVIQELLYSISCLLTTSRRFLGSTSRFVTLDAEYRPREHELFVCRGFFAIGYNNNNSHVVPWYYGFVLFERSRR